MSDKLFVVITVARQVDGEYVFVRTDKGFYQASKADQRLKELKASFIGTDGKQKPVRLSTPQGEADCLCEVGVFEVEAEQ